MPARGQNLPGHRHEFFFYSATATTEIYTLSLHDALPILFEVVDSPGGVGSGILLLMAVAAQVALAGIRAGGATDRKSTRLNSSHSSISYAVFCLKKKKNQSYQTTPQ